MPGPPPKPTELKRLQGNPGHAPIRTPLFVGGRVGPDDRLPAPRYFAPDERRAWAELINMVRPSGLLDRADLTIIEATARTLALLRRSNGRAMLEAVKEYRLIAAVSGLGAANRTRLSVANPRPAPMEMELDRTLGVPGRLRALND